MSPQLIPYLKGKLSTPTSIFGLQLWSLIVAFVTLFILLFFFVISVCFICRRRKKSCKVPFCLPNPIAPNCPPKRYQYSSSSLNRRLLPLNISEIEMSMTKPELQLMYSDRWSNHGGSIKNQGASSRADWESLARSSSGVSEIRLGHFSLREVGIATNSFAYENLVGYGDYGVVYRGVLLDDARVAVKRLLSNSSQTEEFITEAQAIGQVRHRNVVKLLGYCMEDGYRMLVYEYVNNSNLHQWLQGSLGQTTPLSWSVRVNIIRGVAKGLAYLHEDIEPHIVHQNIKSSNILLDHQWVPKISDVALSRLLGPEYSHVTTRSMVKLGYAAQEQAYTSLWDKKSDVYSFGVLILEIISGRSPIDHNQSQIYLIECLKSMVANKRIEDIVDPKMPEIPSIKELKRIILVAFRCVDSDLDHRPKMGEVIHMLEPHDLLLNDGSPCPINRESSFRNREEDSQTSEEDEDGSDV